MAATRARRTGETNQGSLEEGRAHGEFRKAEKAAEKMDTNTALRAIAEGLIALASAVDDLERKVKDFRCRA